MQTSAVLCSSLRFLDYGDRALIHGDVVPRSPSSVKPDGFKGREPDQAIVAHACN